MNMHSSKAASIVVTGLALMGCSVAEPEGHPEAIGESAGALAYVTRTDAGTRTPTASTSLVAAPAVATRRLVRMQSPGCASVDGVSGVWTGAAVASGALSSTAFCAYAWTSMTGAPPDLDSLDAVAMFDEQRGEPYNVHDPRSANTPAQQTSLSTGFIAMAPSLGLTSNTAVPRSSGCGVCVSLEGNDLWLVLPPEAAWGSSVMLHSGNTSYGLGAVSGAVYYAPAPAGLSGPLSLSW